MVKCLKISDDALIARLTKDTGCQKLGIPVKSNKVFGAVLLQLTFKPLPFLSLISEFRKGCKTWNHSPDTADELKEDVFCTHGSLSVNQSARKLISEEAYQILKTLVPGFQSFDETTSECQYCMETKIKRDHHNSRSVQRSAREKSQLKRLLDDRKPLQIISGKTYFIIPQGEMSRGIMCWICSYAFSYALHF